MNLTRLREMAESYQDRNELMTLSPERVLDLISAAESAIPIESHYCRTTHTACDCVLTRLGKLEEIAISARLLTKSTQWTTECDNCGTDWQIVNEDMNRLIKSLEMLEGDTK